MNAADELRNQADAARAFAADLRARFAELYPLARDPETAAELFACHQERRAIVLDRCADAADRIEAP